MTNYNPQELQQKYEEWCALYRQQLKAQQQFLQAEALLNELKDYYLNPQWMADREADLPIEHSGKEHSIFSEDTLWNMLTDRDELARQWMRLGLDAIDRK
ncbi:DUF4298 domain-containing protein [Psychrobacter sp. ANT_H56B]|uniref:DUF4298 domain-containing protein n=1 Tax=Psychrobacter sp. ANT_H56B TaxID=2597353 RepID=UPI0011F2EAF6|nr:DUF4298 domain-containing protein [Psychrobacter sp. ANT_H56B]KAA0921583.1 DUF4298 domain-containing protein [Psychrobacter sp. ANT_H56B]